MKALTLSILMLAVAFSPFSIQAGIRCGNDIISEGDTTSEVMIKLSRCGEVISKEMIKKETHVETKADTNEKASKEKVKTEKLIELWQIRVVGPELVVYSLCTDDGTGLLLSCPQFSICMR